MRYRYAVSPHRRRSAVIGVVLSVVGLAALIIGSFVLPVPDSGRFYIGLALIVFGVLLAATGVLVFVVPAALSYWEDAVSVTPVFRTRF